MHQDAIWEYFQNEGVAFDGVGPRLEFLVRELSDKERVLNIGVGSGALEKLAAHRGLEIWAVDPSKRTIEALRVALNLGERAQVGYSQKMPFPADFFDVVIMTEVLEHLEDDVRHQTLEEVRRILRPNGRFIGTVPARERLPLSQVVCPTCGHRFHRWGHEASFTIASMRAFLGQTFFVETVHERFFNEWHSANWYRRLTGLLKKFLSWRGVGTYGTARNIYFVAKKVWDQKSKKLESIRLFTL